jgi:hypothetical protein
MANAVRRTRWIINKEHLSAQDENAKIVFNWIDKLPEFNLFATKNIYGTPDKPIEILTCYLRGYKFP